MNKLHGALKLGIIVVVGVATSVGVVRTAVAHENHSVTQSNTAHSNPEEHIEDFRHRLISETDRRLGALKGLQQRVERSSELSTAHKSAFVAQIDTEVKTLEAMKLEMTAASSVDALRVYVEKLKSEFRSYSLIVPKANLLRVIDRQLVLVEKVDALSVKLQTRIDAHKTQGQNVAKLELNINDVRRFLGNARQRAQTAELEVATLTPSSYVNDRKVLNTHYEELKSAHKELMAAVRLSRAVTQELVGFSTK